eukprot:7371611-Prymnesium_polylepis.1
MTLANAYKDRDVYIQCGLKKVTPPDTSPVWGALHETDRRLVRRLATRGGWLFGKLDRVATFITPLHAGEKITSTHYDDYNGFLCVVRGAKTVFVAAPDVCANQGMLKPNETPQTPFDTP